MKKNIDIVVSKDRFRKNIGDLEDLKESIRKYGQIRPVLIDKKGNLISGFRRYKACVELDIEPNLKVVEFDDPKCIEYHDNIHAKPYTPREVYDIWQYINQTEKMKPGPKDDNSMLISNGIRPIDKASMVTGMGTSKLSQIITIFKSTHEDIKTKLDEEKISVYSAYNMVKKQEIIATDLENEAKEKDRFELNPYPYEEGMYYQPQKYSKKYKHNYIIKEGQQYHTLTTRTGFFHPAPSGKDEDAIEFTLREYASIQDFSADVKFVGSFDIIRKQIGNAVSPKMGKEATKDLKGKTCGDLFAGCGGFSLGAHKNGIETTWAVEWDIYAAKSYQLNFPECKVHQENLKFFKTLKLDKVDIIIGSPPCQGLSKAGHQFKDDPRNDGYKWFLDVINTLRPAEFIMENVPEILDRKEEIKEEFAKIGYGVETELIKGEEIGMRQHRSRAFFFGTRRDAADSQEMAIAA